MKIILIGLGVILIGFALFLSFGIIVYSLKEKDEDLFLYMTLPIGILIIGIALFFKGKRIQRTE